jgi:hypothetical protein
MPVLFWVLTVRAIEEFCRRMRKAHANKPRPLCTDWVHAHVQYA